VVLSGAAGAAQRLISVAATFYIYPHVLHALGPDRFGLWAAAASLATLLFVADFGIGSAIVTLVSEAEAMGRPDAARRHMTAALVLAIVVSILLVAAGSAAAVWLAPPSATSSYLLAVLGLGVNIPLGLASSAWTALQRAWMVALNDFVQMAILVISLSLIIDRHLDELVYVLAVYVSWLVANAISLAILMIRHADLRPAFARLRPSHVRVVADTGGRYFILSGLDALSYLFDTVIALQLLGGAAAAQMAIAQRVCVAATGLLMVMAQPLWPAFVEAAARGDHAWIRSAVVRGTVVLGLAAAGGASILILFGRWLSRLWLGDGMPLGAPLIWSMGAWIIFISLPRVLIILLNSLKMTRFQIGLFAMSTLFAMILKFILAPIFGVSAILLSTAATAAIMVVPALAWRVERWLRRGSAGLAP
jgi:O-antigen/teichoic acid export membrane protein